MMHSTGWTLWELLLIAATLEIIGGLAFKWWAETDRWLGLVIGLVVYSLALILFAHLLRRAELAVIFALWVGVAAVLLALAGWWFFDEVLSLRHLAGLALVIGGMILLQIGRNPERGRFLRARAGRPGPPRSRWFPG
jgi:small multidrug resistance pump